MMMMFLEVKEFALRLYIESGRDTEGGGRRPSRVDILGTESGVT